MLDVRYIEIGEESAGQRLDNFLFRILKGVPKSHVYRIIRNGEIRVNKKRASFELRLELGDKVRIPPIRCSDEKNSAPVGSRLTQQLLKRIVYEDDSLLVLNKPSGIAVHGGSGLSLGVIEALRAIRTDIAYLELVHRLDKETSGCLLLAKKRSLLKSLQEKLASHQMRKIYWALLVSPWTNSQKNCTVDAALRKNILSSGERIVVVDPMGKPSKTHFRLIENFQKGCWVEACPKTGRTHQIRVHSTLLDSCIMGDSKYGRLANDVSGSSRLYLHARSIQYSLNGQSFTFMADLDDDFVKAIEQLRERSP